MVFGDAELVLTDTIIAPACITLSGKSTWAGDCLAFSRNGTSNCGGDASKRKQRCNGNYEAHGWLWCRLKDCSSVVSLGLFPRWIYMRLASKLSVTGPGTFKHEIAGGKRIELHILITAGPCFHRETV